MKKRILVVNEFSELATGYSTYGKELLNGLYKSGKYDIAEFAAYAEIGDSRIQNIPWRVYCNMPNRNNQEEIQRYNSNTIHHFGSWRFDEVALDFQPTHICSPPGQLVMTEHGHKPIEDIVVGEKVLTHKHRFKKVTKTMRHQHEGVLIDIKFNGCKEHLKLTDNHPVLVYRKRKQTNQKKSFAKIYDGVDAEFIEAGKLKTGDLILLSYPDNYQLDYHTINIGDYLNNFYIEDDIIYAISDKAHSINRSVVFNADIGRLVGYYLSDGCATGSVVNFFFSIDELEYAEDVQKIILDNFGLSAKIEKSEVSEMYNVTVCSTLLYQFFKKWLGTAKNKRIPMQTWNSPRETREGIVCGLVRGDGCYKKNTVSLSNVNKYIAHDYRILCLTLNIPTNLQKKTAQTTKSLCTSYDIEGYGNSSKQLHNIVKKWDESPHKEVNKSCRTTQIINNYLVASISGIKKQKYKGQVYNLEVQDDNSYVIQQSCVHNCAIRDPWMDSFVFSSPFRKYYRLIWMPTVDSAPQEEAWINDCIDADAILTYSDYGQRVLAKEGGGKINLCGVASPGANFDDLKPIPNKVEHRQRLGWPIDPNCNIIGTVMRNQPRKLFPDLFEAFSKYIKLNPNTYLYCHTSYPDNGWEIPRLIRDYGIANKVLFTYICRNCKHMSPQFFSDAVTFCPNCRELSLTLPNQQVSLSKNMLGAVYNTFDVYVQHSCSEGFGMPIVEAAACGIPVMITDATAMEDFSKKLSGTPIPIHKTFLDTGTHAYRFYPSNDALVQEWSRYFSLPREMRNRKGFNVRQLCEQNYTWDATINKWMSVIDSLPTIPPYESWQSPPKIHQPNLNIPEIQAQADFANWCMVNILGRPELVNSFYSSKLTKDLSYGAKLHGYGGPYLNEHSLMGVRPTWEPFTREHAVQRLANDRQMINFWEHRRCSQRQVPDFIMAAHQQGK